MNEFLIILFSIIVGVPIGMFISKLLVSFFSGGGKPPGPAGPRIPIAQFLEEINVLVKLEILAIVEIPQAVKEIPLIQDFNEIQTTVIHNVVESLSSQMWLMANQSGITRNYLIKYITRRTHAEMLDFMEQHNYSLKDDSNTYIEKVKEQLNFSK
jgi:hypothetical protein